MTEQLQSSIAFLPVNPSISPLRNQGRQKLATLDAQAFAQLVVDLLLDTKRRQTLSLETGECVGVTYDVMYAIYDVMFLIYDVMFVIYDVTFVTYDVMFIIYDVMFVIYDVMFTGSATGSLVPSTSEDKPPTPIQMQAPPTELSEIAYDPHDYDEVPADELVRTSRHGNENSSVSVFTNFSLS